MHSDLSGGWWGHTINHLGDNEIVIQMNAKNTAITEMDAKVRAITQAILQSTTIIQIEAKDRASNWYQGNRHI